MAKSKRMITVRAGRLVYSVVYTQAMSSDTEKARAAKNKCSSLARQKLNFVACYKKLQLLIAANFTRNDLYITFGFDDAHLPPNRKEAKKIIQKFFDRVRAMRKANGEELKYIYAIHELQDDGSRRLHFHMIINSTQGQKDFEMIRSLWECGSNIEINEICKTEYYHHDDFLELAQYLVRERNPDAPLTAVGDKGFVGSRNLDKPVRTSEMVDDGLTVCAPPGSFILDTDTKSNEYGQYAYISYLLPEERTPKKAQRSKRKKE